MLSKTRKELIFGIVVLLVGVVYMMLTMRLPRHGGIDSATVPYLLASLITVLGILQTVNAVRAIKAEAATESATAKTAGTAAPRPDYRTVALTAGLITLYVVFLDMFGFPLMSALYLFIQFIVLTPNYARKNHLLYAFIAVFTSLFVYYLFLYAFDMMLPDGNFWYDIGLIQ